MRLSLNFNTHMNPGNCLNCGNSLLQGQKYCPQCGQKADTHRISLHEIMHDALHYITHADKGIFHLIKQLAKRPGIVAREYIDGRRKTYFKPLNFLLIVAGIVVFMTNALHKDYPRPTSSRSTTQAERPAPPTAAQLAMYERAQKASKFTSKYSNVINLLATPVFAAFIWLFYYRGRYNYIEHLVANMYFVPFIMLAYAFIVVPVHWFTSSYRMFMAVLYAFFAFEIIYRGLAYYQFMGKKGAWPLIKALGVSAIASGVWITFTSGLIRYYIRHGF
jgi:hypothetical protein